jgi:hypothetical protein
VAFLYWSSAPRAAAATGRVQFAGLARVWEGVE